MTPAVLYIHQREPLTRSPGLGGKPFQRVRCPGCGQWARRYQNGWGCPSCREQYPIRVPCSPCEGTGEVGEYEFFDEVLTTCPDCWGTGELIPCLVCGERCSPGGHDIERHLVCSDHAPDCTGVCHP